MDYYAVALFVGACRRNAWAAVDALEQRTVKVACVYMSCWVSMGCFRWRRN